MNVLLITTLSIMFLGVIGCSAQIEDNSRIAILTVNGQPIYEDQLSLERATLDPSINETIPDEQIIEYLIERTVLLQEAKNTKIVVNQLEIQNLLVNLPQSAQRGIETEEMLYERLAEQVAITKLLEKKESAVIIRHEDVQAVFNTLYKDTNVSFESVEEELTLAVAEQHKKRIRDLYIESLKEKAEVVLLKT